MKKLLLGSIVLSTLLTFVGIATVHAATIPPQTAPQATFDSSDNIEVNKNILFDASRSIENPDSANTSFIWNFGDDSGGSGKEIIHTYAKPGIFHISLKVSQGAQTVNLTKDIFVFERSQTVFVDRAHDTNELHQLTKALQQKNILVQIYTLPTTLSVTDENFINHSTFVYALSEPGLLVNKNISDTLRNKTIIIAADSNLQVLERLSKNSFSSIGAGKIILTSEDAVLSKETNETSILEANNNAELTGIITNRKLPFAEVNTQEKIGIGNFMLAVVNYLRSAGMPDTSLFLLLCIPFIVAIISFFRQFIGIATLGIYTPTIFTIVFLVIGGMVGSATFIILGLASALLRRILRNVRIMYVPKMALVLIGATITLISMFVLAAVFNYRNLVTLDIFPMMLLLTMGERFISLELERGFRRASFLFLETIVVSLVAYFLLDYQKTTILAYPEIALLMIPLIYIIGKWTGLRISEVLRFRDLIDSVEQESEE